MRLKPKEAEIIRQLLAHHNIHVYEVEAISEGKQLPGSTFPGELQSMSGYIITPTTVYNFWFDWVDGHYSLGEEDGNWGEATDEEMKGDEKAIRAIQQRLRLQQEE